MNPKTPTAQAWRVEREVRRIREAWPAAQVRYTTDRLAAVVIIHEPASTYIIEVEPGDLDVVTRSLHVPHRSHYYGMIDNPQWRDGWVD